MAKARRSKKQRKSKAQAVSSEPAQPSRRDVMRLMQNGAIATAAVAGGGYWAFGSFRAYAAEHDLSRVGQGAPTIVQVHDPQCPTCTALQRETRRALKEFDGCGLTYLVADIKTEDGAAFARRYAVPHVTLLLFDGDSELRETVHGTQQAAHLSEVFSAHKAAVA